jgi:hypothetical protein
VQGVLQDAHSYLKGKFGKFDGSSELLGSSSETGRGNNSRLYFHPERLNLSHILRQRNAAPKKKRREMMVVPKESVQLRPGWWSGRGLARKVG